MTDIDKYRQGYERGKAAIEDSRGEQLSDMPEKVVKGVIGFPREAITDFFRSSDEDRGYRDALDGKDFDPSPTADEVQERQEEHRQTYREKSQRELPSYEPNDGSSGGDSSGTDIIVKIVVFGLLFFAILWFVFAVAIPLLMIDIAAIALIASFTRKHLSKWLLPLSVGGAVLVVVDYNQGWSTKSLATNVSFLAGLVPVLLYLNVLAGLIAAYFLIRNFMDARTPHPANAGELTRRNVIAMGCLLLLGCLTFGLQTYVDAQRREVRQTLARQVEVTNRQVDAIRIADQSDNRARVLQGIQGKWYASNGSSEPTVLKITKTGGTFIGEYTSVIGPEVLSAELQADNKLHLVNERQVGKLVQPGHYYEGDFAQEAWAELSADGSSLSIRQSSNERSFVMHRGTGPSVPDNAEVSSQMAQQGDSIRENEERETLANTVRVNRDLRPEIPIMLSGTKAADYTFVDPDLQASGAAEIDVRKLIKRSDNFSGMALYYHLKESGMLANCLNVQDLTAMQSLDVKLFRKVFGYGGRVEGWKSVVLWKRSADANSPNDVTFFYPVLSESVWTNQLTLGWAYENRIDPRSPDTFETISYHF